MLFGPDAVLLHPLLLQGPPDDASDADRRVWSDMAAQAAASRSSASNESQLVHGVQRLFEKAAGRPMAADDAFWRRIAIALLMDRFWRSATTAGDLFRPLVTWGLRGDPHLFNAVASAAAGVPLPETEDEMRDLVRRSFHEQTGQPLHVSPLTEENNCVAVDQFRVRGGGMSSGLVSRELWRKAEHIIVLRWAHARGVRAFTCPLSDADLCTHIGYVPERGE